MTANGWRPEAAAGWLADQLPRPLSDDHFTRSFVAIFEQVAGSVRSRVTGFQDYLDPDLAPPEFVRWLGSWLGVVVESSLPEDHQRSLVVAAGQLLPYRGTRRGLKGLLEAFTRGTAEIDDGGGVFREGEATPGRHHVDVSLSTAGALNEEHLLELVRQELPASASFELKVGRKKISEPAGMETPGD